VSKDGKRDSKKAGRANVHSCLPLFCCLETKVSTTTPCDITVVRGEKNQSAAEISARHQYISRLQSDTDGSLPFYFVLKKLFITAFDQPRGLVVRASGY
jgi:hypothetical protein